MDGVSSCVFVLWRVNERGADRRGGKGHHAFVGAIAGKHFTEFELYFIYAIMMQFCCWR